MKNEKLILGLDIATCCGWALGRAGEIPRCNSIRFGTEDASDNAIFAAALRWFSAFLKQERPELIILERMLPPDAKRGKTRREVRDRLAGLHGVLRAVAHLRGIYDIADVDTLTVRKHFCGEANVDKQRVFEKCRMLGWPCNDLNASDAAACWSFACGLIQPETALALTPLFGGRPWRVSA
jgi:hypothetical protein